MRRGSVRGKSRRRFQPSSKCSTDRPSTSCMKPLSLPPPRSKQSMRWRQSSGSKTCGKREDRRRRGRRRPGPAAPPDRAAQHPIALVQRRDVDDPQHRVEDDPGSVGAEGAREALAVPQKPDRRKSRLERAPRSRVRFGDDSEEGGLAFVDQAPVGRERLQRGLRRGIGDRAEEGERDRAAGKGIEGQAMAPPIEEKGAVAPLSAGLEREVE